MKIILLMDVKSQGKKGDIVDVSEGYARNYLIPQGKALQATAANLNTLKLQKAGAAKQAAEELAEAKRIYDAINDKTVIVKIKGGEGGRAYGSVSSKEIAQAIADTYGEDIDKKKIEIEEILKTFGTHEVIVKLHKEVSARIYVNVTEL